MDPKKMEDVASRLRKGGRGVGLGGTALAVIGAVGYALSKSFYTGLSDLFSKILKGHGNCLCCPP